jgi:hypothetical protein
MAGKSRLSLRFLSPLALLASFSSRMRFDCSQIRFIDRQVKRPARPFEPETYEAWWL